MYVTFPDAGMEVNSWLEVPARHHYDATLLAAARSAGDRRAHRGSQGGGLGACKIISSLISEFYSLGCGCSM